MRGARLNYDAPQSVESLMRVFVGLFCAIRGALGDQAQFRLISRLIDSILRPLKTLELS
jgi:hypothetical protein